MKLIFLGTGTSQGVPMIGQDSSDPMFQNPKNWRTRSSIHLVMDGVHIQVDAGQEFRTQCLKYDINWIDLFILTHGHADHILGMDDLRRFNQFLGGNMLPVYSTESGLERIAAIYPYALNHARVTGYPGFNPSVMPQQLDLEKGGVIRSTRLKHGPIEVLGLVFEEASSGKRITYYTDCEDVSPDAQALATGSDIVILDGLRYRPHPTHMHIDQAVAIAKAIGAPQTYLTHMNFEVEYDTAMAHLPAGIALAYDGLILTP